MKHQLPITKIMTKDVITLDCNDNLETAEILFKRNNIRHIPVVKNKSIRMERLKSIKISKAGHTI